MIHKDKLTLLEFITKKNKAILLAHPEIKLTFYQKYKLRKFSKRLNKSEPISYIIGKHGFYNSTFLVNRHTLIPRVETEMLVSMVIQEIGRSNKSLLKLLDIGTGTGAIPISIRKEVNNPELEITATDISKKALKTAKRNAKLILPKTKNNIHFQRADILSNKNKTIFDIIISNPPYIPTNEYHNLDKSVKDFEPQLALDGGKDGLDIYRRILEKTKNHSNDTTQYFFEIHTSSAEALATMLHKHFPRREIITIKDQFKRNRFIQIA